MIVAQFTIKKTSAAFLILALLGAWSGPYVSEVRAADSDQAAVAANTDTVSLVTNGNFPGNRSYSALASMGFASFGPADGPFLDSGTGLLMPPRSGNESDRRILLTGIRTGKGKEIVQIALSGEQANTYLKAAMNLEPDRQAIYAQDATAKKHPLLGYMVNKSKMLELEIDPVKPIGTISDIKALKNLAQGETLWLVLSVPKGTRITKLTAGNKDFPVSARAGVHASEKSAPAATQPAAKDTTATPTSEATKLPELSAPLLSGTFPGRRMYSRTLSDKAVLVPAAGPSIQSGSGTLVPPAPGNRPDPEIMVKEIRAPKQYAIVQLAFKSEQAEAYLKGAANLPAAQQAIYLQDADGKKFRLVGYMVNKGEKMDFKLDPEQGLRTVSEIAALETLGQDETLWLVFFVPRGARVAKLVAGEKSGVVKLSVPE
jgi:hypothetical protein